MQPPSLSDELGPDGREVVRLSEVDLRRQEAVLNEHQRTAFTIRGYAVTVVAALIAAGFASRLVLPEYFAMGATVFFFVADYYYSRLYAGVQSNARVLESLLAGYRRLLTGRGREDEVLDFRGDLRAYARRPIGPDRRTSLWPPRQVGALKLFLVLYVALLAAAIVGAGYVGSRPDRVDPDAVQRYLSACRHLQAAGDARSADLAAALTCP